MSNYLFGEKARKFLRAQGSNLRLKEGYCIEIDESGEWWVKDLQGDLMKGAEVLCIKSQGPFHQFHLL